MNLVHIENGSQVIKDRRRKFSETAPFGANTYYHAGCISNICNFKVVQLLHRSSIGANFAGKQTKTAGIPGRIFLPLFLFCFPFAQLRSVFISVSSALFRRPACFPEIFYLRPGKLIATVLGFGSDWWLRWVSARFSLLTPSVAMRPVLDSRLFSNARTGVRRIFRNYFAIVDLNSAAWIIRWTWEGS